MCSQIIVNKAALAKERERDKRYCIAYWCLNSNKKNPDLSFFSLPQDPERRSQWLKLIGREDLADRDNLKCRSHVVCSTHFEKSQFRLVRHLYNDALPKQVSVSNLPLQESTTLKNEESSLKRKLLDEPTTSEKKNRKSVLLTKDPISIYPEESEYNTVNRFHKLLEWKNKLQKKNRYVAEFKCFALNLLIYSPHAYQCFKTILKLPSKKRITSYKLNIPPNLDDRVLNCLAIKLKSLPDVAKYCIICIDKFPLKSTIYYDTKADEITGFHSINDRKKTELAKNAFVIMIKGIYFKWQQVVAYTLLGEGEYYDELDTWLNNVICKLSIIGIEIKAITSDDSPYFTKFAKEVKNVTEVNPYIIYNDKPTFYIFNVPSLMTSIRNYLLTSNLCYGVERISWNYIKTLYEKDVQVENKRRLLSKLTSSHIEPNKIEKKNIQFAVETLSGTVSAVLHMYIDLKHISEEARPTALFIEKLNNLFDLLNSSKLKCKNEIQGVLKMSTKQREVIKEAIEMLTVIKYSTGNTDVIKNFEITIKSVQMLYADLNLNTELTYIPTRRLNKDCLETLITQQNFRYLTPIQFRRKFSNMFLSHLIKNSPPYTSCGLDFCDLLSKIEDVNKFATAPEPPPVSAVALRDDNDYQMELPEDNTVIYVSCYLLYKCTKKHKCPSMDRFWDSCRNLSGLNLFSKDLNEMFGFTPRLKIPPKEFIQYIQNLESTITQNLFRLIKKSPGTQLFKLLKTVPAKVPCTCFPLSYFLKLFVRLRIYQTLKFNNSGKSSDKKFLKIKHL